MLVKIASHSNSGEPIFGHFEVSIHFWKDQLNYFFNAVPPTERNLISIPYNHLIFRNLFEIYRLNQKFFQRFFSGLKEIR